jgi:phosphate transport system permease protein
LKVIIPTAGPGIVTGLMLAIGRASGETAPLLFTALGNTFISTKLNGPMSALPLIIYQGATSAFTAFNQRAWGAALTLIVLVLVFTLGGRALANRRARSA